MTTWLTIETSLRADASVRAHGSRRDAERFAIDLLVNEGGWPRDCAAEIIVAGRPALVLDDGNDWEIRVEGQKAA